MAPVILPDGSIATKMATTTADTDDDGRPIPVNIPKFWGNEEEKLAECIKTGWISSEGPFVAEFEQAFARSCQRKFGVACANGSAALDIVWELLDLQPGDEVILPTLTIISCINGIVKLGAKPVLVDCAKTSWNLDVEAVSGKITERTKAVLAVHVYEYACDMEGLQQVIRDAEESAGGDRKIFLVEDNAELIGGSRRGRPTGSFGDISTVSFYPNKHITTGEGGMVLTDDANLYERARMTRNLCFDPQKPRFVHEKLGFNYRMTSMQAALGLAQLENLPAAVERKREIGRLYNEELLVGGGVSGTQGSACKGVRLPTVRTEDGQEENIFWVYMVEITLPEVCAKEVMQALAARKVGTRPCFYPMHLQPVFREEKSRYYQEHFAALAFPEAERLTAKSFYLPSGLGMTDDDVRVVASRFREVMAEFANRS